MTDSEELVRVAERAARAGGAVAAGSFRRDLVVERKAEKTDLVTRADRETQRVVVATIRESYPEDAIVGEEEDELKEVPETGPAWVVDPIDGTNNFVQGVPLWTTSVAAVRDGEAVAAANVLPTTGDVYTADGDGTYRNGTRVRVSEEADPDAFTVAPTFWWDWDSRDEYVAACREIVERFADLRRYGSAQATLSLVAEGGLEATITNLRANPWDTVAGAFMVDRAGGTVTGLDGGHWTHASEGLVASNGRRHDAVLDAARAIAP
jgi:myo-inositol-1(or 4)-monophosphatase